MVVVAGGGFAGRIAAVRLRRAGLPVQIVDPRSDSVERTRLHQLAARETRVEWSIGALAGRIGAEHVCGRVARVERDRVLLDDGRTLPFDQLVIATGSVSDDGGVPGVREHAAALDSPADAIALRERASRSDGVVVVGAGLTGIELACELAETRPGVVLVGSLSGWSPRAERLVRDGLAALGVDHREVRVTAVDARGVETTAGRIDAGLVAWTAGMKASPWLASSGLPVAADGRLQVDSCLRVVGHPAVVAAGDCAGTELRMACATAMPMGCHAASVVAARAGGREPTPFGFAFAARCASMGRGRAVLQGVDARDRPTWAVGGRTAVAIKETILWAVARLPDWEAGSGIPLYGWPRRELAPQLAVGVG